MPKHLIAVEEQSLQGIFNAAVDGLNKSNPESCNIWFLTIANAAIDALTDASIVVDHARFTKLQVWIDPYLNPRKEG